MTSMPRKNGSYSISMTKVTYDRIKEHCKKRGMSMSQFVDKIAADLPETKP